MLSNLKITSLALCLMGALMLIGAGTVLAQGISGTRHDFTSGGGGSFTGAATLCEACHVPHNPAATNPQIPLQNHPNTAATSWTKYASTTLNATMGNPSGVDLVCLGCHDGSVAIDAYGGGANATFIAAAYQVGGPVVTNVGDLSSDHPVSFSYAEVDVGGADPDPQIKPVATPEGAGLKFFNGALKDVKCATCHDPHDNPGGTSYGSFLRATKATICTQCHLK